MTDRQAVKRGCNSVFACCFSFLMFGNKNKRFFFVIFTCFDIPGLLYLIFNLHCILSKNLLYQYECYACENNTLTDLIKIGGEIGNGFFLPKHLIYIQTLAKASL